MAEAQELTVPEKNAIAALKRAGRLWPETLWLLVSDGNLFVMRNADGMKAHYGEDFDADLCIDQIYGVEIDAGDMRPGTGKEAK